jgi:tetratricopeptide (TPR) repeat protein
MSSVPSSSDPMDDLNTPQQSVAHLKSAARRSTVAAVSTATGATLLIGAFALGALQIREQRLLVEALEREKSSVELQLTQKQEELRRYESLGAAVRVAVMAFYSRRYEEALTLLKDILVEAPDTPAAWRYAGMCNLRIDRPANSVAFLRKALTFDDGYTEARYWLAKALLHLGRTSQAVREIRLIVNSEPTYRHLFLGERDFRAYQDNPGFRDILDESYKHVLEVQQLMNALGEPVAADGIMGVETRSGLRRLGSRLGFDFPSMTVTQQLTQLQLEIARSGPTVSPSAPVQGPRRLGP